MQRLLSLNDSTLHWTSAHLIVEILSKQCRCALLIGGRVQTEPKVDDVLLLARRSLLVAIEKDVAVAAVELTIELGSLLNALEVLDAPDLQTLLRRSDVVLHKVPYGI